MKIAELARIVALTGCLALTSSRGALLAQVEGPGKLPSGPTMESINTEYERDLLKVERQRLEKLGLLAMGQPKDQKAVTLESYFRLAIAKNLYAEAEPIAKKVIESGDPSGVVGLAYLVEIVGLADKGAYEASLASLATAIKLRGEQGPAAKKEASLSVGTKASIIDAYYQRLVHGDQVDVARKAMKIIVDTSEVPAIRDLAARRLKQVDLVGKPAPAVVGVDLEGKPFKLEDAKGEVVLVVFWATWCLPNAQEMPWLDYLYLTYQPKGLKVIGINLDSAQHGSKGVESALPNIRRFLVDYNVTWPTWVNGSGDQDYAAAFAVTEIPANVLIGRDGKVSHIDLTGRKLEKAVAAAIAEKR
jgi:thiol-disulfide isomerase/thioredoxin